MHPALAVVVSAPVVFAAALPAQVPPHAVVLNPGGATFLSPIVTSQLGDTVHALAPVEQPWPSSYVWGFYARSLDGGRTWPVREVPIGWWNHITAITATPSFVIAVGGDERRGPQVTRSTDGGDTWTPMTQVSTATSFFTRGMRPQLHVDGANVTVVWLQARTSGAAWANRSTDGGATWQPVDTPLDTGLPPSVNEPFDLHLVAEGATLHAFWSFTMLPSFTTATAYQRSVDGGATWLPAAQVVRNDHARAVTGNASTLLLVDSTHALHRSSDGGLTWNPVGGVGVQQVDDIAMAGSLAVAVGQDPAASIPTHVVNTSADGGATWRTAPLRLPSDNVYRSRCFVSGGTLFVHFTRAGHPGLVIQSDDAGASWRAVSGLANEALWAGERRTMRVVTSGSQWLVYVAQGFTPRGDAFAGTGNLAPRLSGQGLPSLGATTTLRVDDAVGGALGALGLSAAPPMPVTIGAWTLWLQNPIAVHLRATGGAAGVAGAGSFAVTLAIPPAPALAGLQVIAQAIVFDSGAAGGIAVTNAADLWVR